MIGALASIAGGGLLKKLMLPLAFVAVALVAAVGLVILENAKEAGGLRVEALRMADAAAATAETLDRTTASVEALQDEQTASTERVRAAEREAGDLRGRLADALADAEHARFEAAIAAESAEQTWQGQVCPIGCVVPVPVAGE